MFNDSLKDEEAPLVEALRKFQPARPALTPHDIAFRAGYAAGRRRSALWQTLALAALLLCGASILLPTRSPAPQQAYKISNFNSHISNPKSKIPPALSDTSDMPDTAVIAANLRLRNLILQHGPDALPRPPAPKDRIAPPANLNIPGLSPWMRLQLKGNGPT